jgi:hypothetical protein
MKCIPISKIAATIGGAGLAASAVWLNAEHVAESEGWQSPLVVAGVIVTICAASAPPLAERAAKTGQPLKAAMLWAFFVLAVGFSLSASIARSSGYVAGKAAAAEQSNDAARLAREAYEAAKASQAAECATGRGSRCRAAEDAVSDARKALARAAPMQSADPGSERLAAVLGVDEGTVQLYAPLLLPLGLELGGYIFLAFGLAPATRRKDEDLTTAIAAEPIAMAAATHDVAVEPAATPAPAAAKSGTRAYYLQRLEREHPAVAAKVAAGELSVYAATIETGLRKAPAKAAKWTKIDAYLETEKAA